MDKKIRMAIVGLDIFPIPAIKGGAIESGVTRSMNLNERFQLYDLTVITISDPDLDEEVKKYKHCRVIQIKQGKVIKTIMLVYRIIRKLSGYRLPQKTAYMYKVNRFLEKENFDIVQFATSNNQVAELSNGVKSLIIYGVGSDYLTMQSYGIEKILKRVDYYSAGPYLRERMMSMLGIPEEKFLKSSYSIDSNIPDENNIRAIRNEIRAKHGISQDELVIIYVGRLSPGKGPLQLIQAMQRVKNCRLIVVGGANFSSSEETDYVKSLRSEAKKCDKEVIFTGYVKEHNDVKKYMFASDMACVPSICNEAGSIALLEFRVASLPTVISDKGGMKYHAGGNCITVKCDENYVQNLAEAIQRVCDDSEYRAFLAAEARKGLENHTPEGAYKRRHAILMDILKKAEQERGLKDVR